MRKLIVTVWIACTIGSLRPAFAQVKQTKGQILFYTSILAEAAVSKAEFTNLQDAFNFELNSAGKNGAEFEGGWTAEKLAAFGKWVDAHPEKLKMSRARFAELLMRR